MSGVVVVSTGEKDGPELELRSEAAVLTAVLLTLRGGKAMLAGRSMMQCLKSGERSLILVTPEAFSKIKIALGK